MPEHSDRIQAHESAEVEISSSPHPEGEPSATSQPINPKGLHKSGQDELDLDAPLQLAGTLILRNLLNEAR
jgi:hypothetical protein